MALLGVNNPQCENQPVQFKTEMIVCIRQTNLS